MATNPLDRISKVKQATPGNPVPLVGSGWAQQGLFKNSPNAMRTYDGKIINATPEDLAQYNSWVENYQRNYDATHGGLGYQLGKVVGDIGPLLAAAGAGAFLSGAFGPGAGVAPSAAASELGIEGVLSAVDPFTGAVSSVPAGTTNILGAPIGIPASISPELTAAFAPQSLFNLSAAAPSLFNTAEVVAPQTSEIEALTRIDPLTGAVSSVPYGATDILGQSLGIPQTVAPELTAARVLGDWWTTPGFLGNQFEANVANAAAAGGQDMWDWLKSNVKLTDLLGVGGNLYSAISGSNAAKKAADQMVLGNLLAQQTADERLKPWLETGGWALGNLKDLLTNPVDEMLLDPGYQFRLDQGIEAINRAQAARGALKSGATLKKLLEYGQGVGSQEYQNIYNRYSNLAGLGTPAAQQSATTAAMLGSGSGQAQASGTVGAQNQINDAISQMLGLLQSKETMNRIFVLPR